MPGSGGSGGGGGSGGRGRGGIGPDDEDEVDDVVDVVVLELDVDAPVELVLVAVEDAVALVGLFELAVLGGAGGSAVDCVAVEVAVMSVVSPFVPVCVTTSMMMVWFLPEGDEEPNWAVPCLSAPAPESPEHPDRAMATAMVPKSSGRRTMDCGFAPGCLYTRGPKVKWTILGLQEWLP